MCGGDWNSKHKHWGSILINTRGREMKKCLDTLSLTALSTGEPTYWPTGMNKLPDHTFSRTIIHREPQSTLYNHKSDWASFGEY